MLDRYISIENASRPHFADFPSMSRHDRAAQFSPFAALVGYGDAVDETARLTDCRPELTEDHACALDAKLQGLIGLLDSGNVQISVTYFVPDRYKQGGTLVHRSGAVRIYDSYARELVFTDGARIPAPDIFSLELES